MDRRTEERTNERTHETDGQIDEGTDERMKLRTYDSKRQPQSVTGTDIGLMGLMNE